MSLNLARKMNDYQIQSAAQVLYEEFYFLNNMEISMVFRRIKTGYYKLFEGLDAAKICHCFREYDKERTSAAECISESNTTANIKEMEEMQGLYADYKTKWGKEQSESKEKKILEFEERKALQKKRAVEHDQFLKQNEAEKEKNLLKQTWFDHPELREGISLEDFVKAKLK